jgi:UDP-glucose 4-epimerase
MTAHRVAVTGSSGYVGGHLVEKLRDGGYEVVGIDHRPETGARVSQFVKLELGDPASIELGRKALEGCSAVFHLASRQPFSWDLYPFVRGNVMRTAHLLEAMRLAGVGRLIHSSTVAVYGRPETLPLTEDTPLHPENPYEVTKAEAETLARLYAEKAGIKVTVLRYPSVYGGRARFGAMYTFVNATLEGAPIRLFAQGTARRDLVHVFDVVGANLLALGHSPASPVGVYNIASGQAPMSRELCDLIFDVLGKKTAVELAEDPNWRSQDLVVDVGRARAELGYAPMPLRQGIAELGAALRAERRT